MAQKVLFVTCVLQCVHMPLGDVTAYHNVIVTITVVFLNCQDHTC